MPQSRRSQSQTPRGSGKTHKPTRAKQTNARKTYTPALSSPSEVIAMLKALKNTRVRRKARRSPCRIKPRNQQFSKKPSPRHTFDVVCDENQRCAENFVAPYWTFHHVRLNWYWRWMTTVFKFFFFFFFFFFFLSVGGTMALSFGRNFQSTTINRNNERGRWSNFL